jgi:hypothetical protein
VTIIVGCTPFAGLETIAESESPVIFAAPGLEDAPQRFGRHVSRNPPGGFIKLHIGEQMGTAPDAEMLITFKPEGAYSSYKPDLVYLLARSRGGGSAHGKALISSEKLLTDPRGAPHDLDYQLVRYREDICLVFVKKLDEMQPESGSRINGWINGYYCPPRGFLPGFDDIETLLSSIHVRPRYFPEF